MIGNKNISKALNIVYVSLLSIIVAGMFFIVGYIAVQANRDPVQYVSLKLERDNYQTSEVFSYEFATCRTAGPEVTGEITRQFVQVEMKNGEWVPVDGKAPVLLFNTVNATNEEGCRTAETTTTMPIVESGYYFLRITGNYTVLQILPPSVDTIQSNVVYITRSEKDSEAPAGTTKTVPVPKAPVQASPNTSSKTPSTPSSTTNITNNDNSVTNNGSTPVKDTLQGINNTVTGVTNGVTSLLNSILGRR